MQVNARRGENKVTRRRVIVGWWVIRRCGDQEAAVHHDMIKSLNERLRKATLNTFAIEFGDRINTNQ